MSLSAIKLKEFRRKAQMLKPVVLLGAKGLTENVQQEIAIALAHHELLKIKLHTKDKSEKKMIAEEICQYQQAELVQEIGQTITIYKHNPGK